MTQDTAQMLFDSKFWEFLTHRQIAAFQLNERLLCMPFSVFHEAVERTLGHPVWTHEFASPQHLKDEMSGKVAPLSMQEILDLIPGDKLIVVNTP